jgi:3-phytase
MVSNTVRFSQLNAVLNRNTEGQLVTNLSTTNNAQTIPDKNFIFQTL